MATIDENARNKLAKTMDEATSDPHKLPGVVFASVNKEGKTIFAHASGKRGIDSEEPMTQDSIFWIASCTKMIVGLACMQLVEAGRLHLDDADQLEKLCPQLATVKILKGIGKNGRPELVEKKNRITLRMLLTHTSGFSYSFFNDTLKRSNGAEGWDEFSGDDHDILNQPLVFEPGTNWTYGVGIDWAGRAIEKTTGLSLNDYMQEHIFRPLGIQEITMFPTEELKSRLSYMHQREGSKIRTRDHLHRRALSTPAEQRAGVFNSGGAGCFARPSEYCKILAALLNKGQSPTTGNRILRSESMDELLKNQIPHMPDFGRVLLPNAKPDLTNAVPELYPVPHDQPQGWNLLGLLTLKPGATGRAAGTTHWAGLANLFWYLDVEQGVAGMIASQILPFADAHLGGLWGEIESGIYKALDR